MNSRPGANPARPVSDPAPAAAAPPRGFRAGIRAFLAHLTPPQVVLLGYLTYALAGCALLSVPFAQTARGVGVLDNLFTSMSAVSTTGLTTVTVGDRYSAFGQAVVLILIQLGGLGYMTFGSIVVLARRDGLTGRRVRILRTVFTLPEGFRIDSFLRSVATYTVVVEAIGAAALWPLLRDAGRPEPLWSAVFHSVSAFCTAGFGLYSDSFESFAGDVRFNAILAALAYAGAIGFIVVLDLARRVRRRSAEITLTSRIILWSTLWLSVAGTVLILFTEPSIAELPLSDRLLAASFQAMTAITTVGFNTIPISGLARPTLLFVTLLMVIGASPSGTGGGLKSTTFTAILGAMRTALRGGGDVRFWGRIVPPDRVLTAVASLGFYCAALFAGTWLLELTESFEPDRILFEAASALGTVGLSTGITADLTAAGKCIVIALMFCGRLGPLTFGIALFRSGRPQPPGARTEDLAV